jgi:hypothetical protein
MYCGIDAPKGKERGTAEECQKRNQVRYYGQVAVEPEILQIRVQPKINTLVRRFNTSKKKLQDLRNEIKSNPLLGSDAKAKLRKKINAG